MEPENPNSYILAGNVYNSIKDYENALKCYKKADEIKPNVPSIMILSANVDALRGDLKSAINTYRKAVSLSKDNGELKLIYYDLIKDFISKKEIQNV